MGQCHHLERCAPRLRYHQPMSHAARPALLLMGAGASFGSDTQGTPPLGARLFSELQRSNPDGWGQLPRDIAAGFERDFEAGMQALSGARPHDMAPLQRAMAAYFFEFRPTGSSLYLQLAGRMRDRGWQGAICSLNYERLLELSLGAAGWQPTVGGPPEAPNQIELCLPHGCCHLFINTVKMAASGGSFSGTQVFFDGPPAVIANPEPVNDFETLAS